MYVRSHVFLALVLAMSVASCKVDDSIEKAKLDAKEVIAAAERAYASSVGITNEAVVKMRGELSGLLKDYEAAVDKTEGASRRILERISDVTMEMAMTAISTERTMLFLNNIFTETKWDDVKHLEERLSRYEAATPSELGSNVYVYAASFRFRLGKAWIKGTPEMITHWREMLDRIKKVVARATPLDKFTFQVSNKDFLGGAGGTPSGHSLRPNDSFRIKYTSTEQKLDTSGRTVELRGSHNVDPVRCEQEQESHFEDRIVMDSLSMGDAIPRHQLVMRLGTTGPWKKLEEIPAVLWNQWMEIDASSLLGSPQNELEKPVPLFWGITKPVGKATKITGARLDCIQGSSGNYMGNRGYDHTHSENIELVAGATVEMEVFPGAPPALD